jgi:Ca-activated chloride channel homolog
VFYFAKGKLGTKPASLLSNYVVEVAMTKVRLFLSLAAVLLFAVINSNREQVFAAASPSNGGALNILGKDGKIAGECPLKHTDVRAGISGFLARVTVTQVFANAAPDKIEAVYVFPLPELAAVDDMTIQVGDRTIRGLIKKREEAQKIYDQAKQQGHLAALLDQERPNIFTQSVANILPNEQVTVTLSYVQNLNYERGAYEFVFPMVVGPRYIPGTPTGNQAGGRLPDTTRVPDGSRISPHITPEGTRAGHDISIAVALDAGVPIQDIRSATHDIDVDRTSATTATIKLKNEAEIPNKDFILKYDVAGSELSDGILFHSSKDRGGFFSLILQPPARFPEHDVAPKELVFVLDTSGSMMGFPIEKAKEVIDLALDGLYPGDTFNLITFSGDTHILFPEPVYPTAENLRKAKAFLASRSGSGGTEMMKAIRAALAPSDSQDHVRVVCFLTDGYVGNDMEIIGEVHKHPKARVFSFGIGNSVNRFLLSKMAEAGRGEVEFVTLADKAEASAHRFYERIRAPLLTDVSIDWGKLPVADVYPSRLPDLFAGKPLVITGRYTAPIQSTIQLRGQRAGIPFKRDIDLNFSQDTPQHEGLASLWARTKIDDLMSQDWQGMQTGTPAGLLREQITQLGLDYRLMTQFTSFVAVEERTVMQDGKPRRVQVPVEMPDGVSYEGIMGRDQDLKLAAGKNVYTFSTAVTVAPAQLSSGSGIGSGSAGGTGGGAYAVGGPMAKAKPAVPHPMAPPPPPPPPNTAVLAIDAEGASATTPSSPARLDREHMLLESKFRPEVIAIFDCWKQNSSGSACKLPKDEMVALQVTVSDNSATTLEKLQALGMQGITQPRAKLVLGQIRIDQLLKLAELKEVQFASLQR